VVLRPDGPFAGHNALALFCTLVLQMTIPPMLEIVLASPLNWGLITDHDGPYSFSSPISAASSSLLHGPVRLAVNLSHSATFWIYNSAAALCAPAYHSTEAQRVVRGKCLTCSRFAQEIHCLRELPLDVWEIRHHTSDLVEPDLLRRQVLHLPDVRL
jgi:hypothetical protein